MTLQSKIRIAAIIATICFWLSWVSVSCSANHIGDFSGYTLAADGIVVSDPTTITGELVTLLDPQPFLFLVPIGAVLAFALSFGQRSKRRSYLKVAGGIAGLLAISITFVGIMNRALEAQQSGSLARYETRLAFWGTVGGLVLIVLFARSEAANQPPPYSPLESDTHELDVDNAT